MQLRSWQREAVTSAEQTLAQQKRGVIRAIMGAGKSVVIAELAARAFRAGLHVVVTVPTQELVRQLANSIAWWTGQVCGQWYADAKELWPITVVCQASIHGYEDAWLTKYERYGDWGPHAPKRLWIADECHRTECDTVLSWDAPKKRIGLSATPWLAEFTGKISSFDEVLYEYGAERAYADGHIVRPTLQHPDKIDDVDEYVAKWMLEQEGGGVANALSIEDANDFAARLGRRAGVVCSTNEHDAVKARDVIRKGGIVVYVNMLAEGFDCPEILWMALRRPVKSRVRFAQEVGRGLRACPDLDKTTCRMLDPYDLWGAHSMNWQAALGDYDSASVPALKLDWMVEKTKWEPSAAGEERMPPELLGPLRSWVRQQRVAALFDGRIDGKSISSRSWRSNPCSKKQLGYLDKLMRGINPASLDAETVLRIRVARAAIVDCISRDADDLDGAFRAGDASDLIDVLRGM